MNPRVSVLIPTYNRAYYLAECLDSLLGQTLTPFQLIVVNDGSTDHTLETLKPYLGKIEYLETPQGGKSVSINQGLRSVRGDYVWIFDDDDVALPDALERFTEPLEKDPAYGFSYSTYYFTGTKPGSHRIGRIQFEEKKPDLEKRGFLIPLLEANILGGAALFARTSTYRAVGEFDPALVRSQDYDVAIRIARRFKGVRVAGGATFHYRQHSGIRGSVRDRFKARLRKKKWWEYDQLIFRRLYEELALNDYLPPDVALEGHHREALLQRLAIAAGKLMLPESLKDLEALERLGDDRPLSDREQFILQRLAVCPFYRVGSLLDKPAFAKRFREPSANTPVLALLHRQIRRSLAASLFENSGMQQRLATFKRLLFF